jgi:heme-degrading monooxygenase HmoA
MWLFRYGQVRNMPGFSRCEYLLRKGRNRARAQLFHIHAGWNSRDSQGQHAVAVTQAQMHGGIRINDISRGACA